MIKTINIYVLKILNIFEISQLKLKVKIVVCFETAILSLLFF